VSSQQHSRSVAEILAQAGAEHWPTSSLPPRPRELAEPDDDTATDQHPIVRPYYYAALSRNGSPESGDPPQDPANPRIEPT
jgi:hypothetical protein